MRNARSKKERTGVSIHSLSRTYSHFLALIFPPPLGIMSLGRKIDQATRRSSFELQHIFVSPGLLAVHVRDANSGLEVENSPFGIQVFLLDQPASAPQEESFSTVNIVIIASSAIGSIIFVVLIATIFRRILGRNYVAQKASAKWPLIISMALSVFDIARTFECFSININACPSRALALKIILGSGFTALTLR